MAARMRATSVPPNEVGVVVPAPRVLARTADAALLLQAVQVFSTGVQIQLQLRSRVDPPFDPGAPPAARMRGLLGSDLMLGVEFADGRRAANLGGPRSFLPEAAAGDVTLVRSGGHGSGRAAETAFFLTPLPPDGPVLLVVAAPGLQLDEQRVELDGAALRAAARDVIRLWDEPEPPDIHGWTPAPPPEPPAGGWFDRRS